MNRLITGQWIKKRLNLLITGPTGTGKSLDRVRVGQQGLPRRLHRTVPSPLALFDELGYAHGDGRYPKVMRKLARTDVIILDDWGLSKLTAPQRRDLLEILEDRHEQRSTLVTSQLPVEHWHKMIGEPTHADAILDRLVHNAYRIALKGESMRKIKAKGGGSLTAQP